jgi:hypothetical protein
MSDIFSLHGIEKESWWTETQTTIISLRLQQVTYDQIQLQLPFLRYHSNISSCLRAVANGYMFSTPENFEPQIGYLSIADEAELALTISTSEALKCPMTVAEVLTEACDIKSLRFHKGAQLLLICDCAQLANDLTNVDIEPPSPQWVRIFSERNSLRVKNCRGIDASRILGCSPVIVNAFFDTHADLISQTPPELIFGADETMLNGRKLDKVVVSDKDVQSFRVENSFPHMTAMLSNNVLGTSLPPFVIIPKLLTPTHEIQLLARSGRVAIASNSKSWMTAHCFCIWAIHFAHWVIQYRESLPADLRRKKCLLIIDGASSRATPWALEYLMVMGIQVLVIPAHTSHLMQMFDIVLASIVKRIFRDKCLSIGARVPSDISSTIGKLRYIAIAAIVSAWSSACDISNCHAAASKAGIFPFNKENVFNSELIPSAELINFLSEKDNRRRTPNRIEISGRVITETSLINELRDRQKTTPKLSKLNHFDPTISYQLAISNLLNLGIDTTLLTKIPYLIISNATPKDSHTYGKIINFD